MSDKQNEQSDRIKKYLWDIATCAEELGQFLVGIDSFSAYMQNKMTRRAVERELEIIGEATKRLLHIQPDFPLTNARRAIDLRNLVAHEYDRVDNDADIWVIATKHVPLLLEEVKKLLTEE
ncbi:MAG: HepT-like ribonuclease domain-containing protein [Thermoguttaceae bacterium]